MTVKFDTRLLDKLIAKSSDKVDEAIRAAAFSVQGKAQGIIQAKEIIDTGATFNSAYTVTSKGSSLGEAVSAAQERRPKVETADHTPGKPGQMTAYVSFATNYAIWLELGTYKMPARPFLSPAMEVADKVFEIELRRVFEEFK